jgi:antitoxin VapB
MALSIKDERTDRLVRALAAETGESLTDAVTIAVEERLARLRGRRGAPDLVYEIRAIAERGAQLELLAAGSDERSAEEILGYDEHGLPT